MEDGSLRAQGQTDGSPPTRDGLGLSRATLERHSKSFSLAARLLPRPVRNDTVVLYAWCRRADDAVDRVSPARRAGALSNLVDELSEIYEGRPPTDPVSAAFQSVVRRCRIPRSYPTALLSGMRMDVEQRRYEELDELLEYCFCVAGTVGLMMCHVMGVRRDDALRQAADLGIAMQLTNIARDVLEDWAMGRLYLPASMLAREGAPWLPPLLGSPFPQRARGPVARVTRELVDTAERYYRAADRGLLALDARCALAVRAARAIYAAIGHRVVAEGADPLAGRAVVPRAGKWRLALAAATKEAKLSPGRLASAGSRTAPPAELHPWAERFAT